ncbi:TonB family protein [Sediminimonas qiaohouensis]|uniref:TonB family protein n=1 Tax=Sediminimonas qiaohouensis TaxID=552061 RepID=UPI00047C88BC|nr:TonB family protein [Sediminimonas qiaohouensis]
MKRLVEMAAFSALAILVHVALFARTSEEGHDAGGSGGTALVSLKAADATVAEMVETWNRPPPQTPVHQPELRPAPALTAPAAQLPRMNLAKAPRAEMRMTALPPAEPEALQLDPQAALPRPQTSEQDIARPNAPETPMPAPDLPRAEMSPPETHAPKRAGPPQQMTRAPSVDTAPAPPQPSEVAPTTSLRPPQRPNAPRPTDVPKTARKAEQTSPGRVAQRAAGSGGSSQAGQKGRADTATASKGQQARAQAVWGAKVRSRIERAKRYPRGTNASGQVSLAISISRTGALLGVNLRRSSGNPVLDQAALDAVRRAGRFPPAPRELPRDAYTFALAIVLKR